MATRYTRFEKPHSLERLFWPQKEGHNLGVFCGPAVSLLQAQLFPPTGMTRQKAVSPSSSSPLIPYANEDATINCSYKYDWVQGCWPGKGSQTLSVNPGRPPVWPPQATSPLCTISSSINLWALEHTVSQIWSLQIESVILQWYSVRGLVNVSFRCEGQSYFEGEESFIICRHIFCFLWTHQVIKYLKTKNKKPNLVHERFHLKRTKGKHSDDHTNYATWIRDDTTVCDTRPISSQQTICFM